MKSEKSGPSRIQNYPGGRCFVAVEFPNRATTIFVRSVALWLPIRRQVERLLLKLDYLADDRDFPARRPLAHLSQFATRITGWSILVNQLPNGSP